MNKRRRLTISKYQRLTNATTAAPGLTSGSDDACPLNLTDAPGGFSSSILDEARAECDFPGDKDRVIHIPAAATPPQGNKANAVRIIRTEKPQSEFEEITRAPSSMEAAGGSDTNGEGETQRIETKFSPLPDDYEMDDLDRLLMAIINESTVGSTDSVGDSGSDANGEEEAQRMGAHPSSLAAQSGGGVKLGDIAFDDPDPFLARIPTSCILNVEGRAMWDRLYQEHWQHLAAQDLGGAVADRDESPTIIGQEPLGILEKD